MEKSEHSSEMRWVKKLMRAGKTICSRKWNERKDNNKSHMVGQVHASLRQATRGTSYYFFRGRPKKHANL